MNFRWVEDSHATWDYHERFVAKLPVNPAGHRAEGDVVLTSLDIANWMTDDGSYEFRPRLRDKVQWVSRIRLATDMDAPELDEELFDCD